MECPQTDNDCPKNETGQLNDEKRVLFKRCLMMY
jgi:hypothetical protein